MGRIYDATWGRLFAAVYDRGMKGTEEAGLGEMRRELLASATGRALEIGAGTGFNLAHYPDAVTELTLTEPDPHMARRLREKLERGEGRGALVEAPAEALPFEDDSFDTVVGTLVLCTAPDPAAAVREVRRVLKPGGRFLVLEHVRSRDPRLARWQDRFEKPWRFLGDGCHCNRDTLATLKAAGFETSGVEHGRVPKAPPIVRPLIRGGAVNGSESRSISGTQP
jgi:ubiquinone/menaquinone biosynthesis C-methylase UbiE